MRRTAVIWLTIALTGCLFVYLIVALLRPENF